ncbi:MAG: LysE family transporter [Hyphomicrobiales bacterium]|nr:LysE family transporter [Hyphomicrobiales bacterium]
MIGEHLDGLLIGWLAYFFGAVAPGPNLVAVASVALGSGRRSAAMIACGVATGTLAWAGLSAYGLAALVSAYPWTIDLLRIIGGLYLFFLGARAFIAAQRGEAALIREDGTALSSFQAWRRGLIVVALNPKSALFWTSIAALVVRPDAPAAVIAVFAAGAMAIALIVYGSYAALFSLPALRKGYARATRYVELMFGTLFCLFGLRLLAIR